MWVSSGTPQLREYYRSWHNSVGQYARDSKTTEHQRLAAMIGEEI